MSKLPFSSPSSRIAPRVVFLFCALSGLTCGTSAFAQTVVASTNPAAGEPDDDVITLDAFHVSTSRTNDYLAAESITGTRIASKIQELPFNVTVATREFIDDFALVELNEQVGFMSSIGQSEGSALPGSGADSVPVRGFTADADLRNGFRRLAGTVHNVSIDRVEAIKGPAAGIYGRIQPGGVVNIVTKKPGTKPSQRISLAAGSHDQFRAEASSTGPVSRDARLYYRVDLGTNTRSYAEKYRSLDVFTGSVQLMWKFSPRTSINFEVEHTSRYEVPGMFVSIVARRGTSDPYRLNPNGTPAGTIAWFLEPALDLLYFNNSGPNVWTDLDMSTITLTLDHRITRNWSLRAGFNLFRRDQERQFISGVPTVEWRNNTSAPDYSKVWNGTSFDTASSGYNGRIPNYSHQVDDGYNFQADLTGAFSTGKINHRLLVTFDVSYSKRDNESQRMFRTPALDPDINGFAMPLEVANPNYYFVSFAEHPELYGLRPDDNYRRSDDNYGLFISERMSLFDNKLILLVGGRYDYVRSTYDKPYIAPADFDGSLASGNAAVYTKGTNDNITYQLGINYALTRSTMLYASHSTSYKPTANANRFGEMLPNENGIGFEAGFKGTWFKEKLNFTFSAYEIKRRNIPRSMIIDFDNDIRDWFTTGEERSRGIELDFNWQFFTGFQIFGGYGYNDTKITRDDERPYLVGTTPRRVPHHNLGAGFRYEVRSGRLKGVFLTGGVRYYDDSIALDENPRNLNPTTHVIVNLRGANGQLLVPQYPEGAYLYRDRIIVNGVETIEISDSIRIVTGDGRSQVINPGYTLIEAGLGYRWRSGKIGSRRLDHRLQLNVKNITDEEYATVSLRPGEPRSWTLTYTLSF